MDKKQKIFQKKQVLASLLICGFGCLLLPSFVMAISGPRYFNPLYVYSFTAMIGNFLANLQGIVGWLAVIMIVIGGVIYITSGGSSKMMSLGKSIIVFALVGFAIAVAAPSLLREIRDIAIGFAGGGLDLNAATPIAVIIANVMDFMLTVVGILAVISFVGSGIMYIMAGGDSNRADTAKKMVFYSIIAVAITGAGLIILNQVLNLLGR